MSVSHLHGTIRKNDKFISFSFKFIQNKIVKETNLLETRGRVANLFEHRPLDSGLSYVDVIVSRILIARRSATRALVAGLVEIRLRDENQRLDRDEHLEETGSVRVPLLFRSAVPRVEHRQAHFAVVVEIGIESDRVPAGGGQMDLHRRLRIVRREVDVKFETAVTVWRIARSRN